MKENAKYIALGFLPLLFGIIGIPVMTTPVFLLVWGYLGYRFHEEKPIRTYFLLHLPMMMTLAVYLLPGLRDIDFLEGIVIALSTPMMFIAGLINHFILDFSTLYVALCFSFAVISLVYFAGREIARGQWGFAG